jgi:hypothetical protein
MQYFGIKNPEGKIWWFAESRHQAWMSFFTFPSDKDKMMLHRLPLAEAIQAYEAIGYKCVELELHEKQEKEPIKSLAALTTGPR